MLPLVFLMWKFLMLDDFHVCVCVNMSLWHEEELLA